MKSKRRPIDDDEALFEMVLGVIFGFGAGLCLAGLAVAFVVAFAPQWIPRPLLLMLGVPVG